MPRLRATVIADLFDRVDRGPTRMERGQALEQIVDETFGRIPGIRVAGRNIVNAFHSEELDRVLYVEDCKNLPLRTMLVLVEAKNWLAPVGSEEVAWFVHKLRGRNLTEGIFIAARGITGRPDDRTSAIDVIQAALAEGISILVVTNEELKALRTTDDARTLLEDKRVLLGATRSSIGR